MPPKMPRGAIPSPRSELAGAQPYTPRPGVECLVPSGHFPTPNHELAAASPYRTAAAAPECFLAWPRQVGFWGNDTPSSSIWAEEAFAKACAEPTVFIPPDVVLLAQRTCGTSNFAAFMQGSGFEMGGKAYLDGRFLAIDWTKEPLLNGAIAHVGPVKIGVALANLVALSQSRFTPGNIVWAVCGLPKSQLEDDWASLCGYGPLAALVERFEECGARVSLPSGMPAGLCYAMFVRGSICIIDQESLMNITGEAWLRTPTTIIRNWT